MNSLRDDQLLRRWAESRSQAAFSELGRRHARMVYGVCLREIGSHDEAEDAAQAVFLLLAQKAPLLRKEGALTGWLFRAARLVSRGALRRQRRRVRREAQADRELRLQADSSGENALWEEVEPLLNDALARLKSTEREIVLLRHFEGHTLAEIGAAFSVPENTARMRVARAVEKVRVSLSKAGVAVPLTALTLLLSERGARSAPEALTQAISRIAVGPAAPPTSGSAARAAQLAKGANRTMILSTLKTISAIICVFIMTAFLGVTAQKALTRQAPTPNAPALSESRAEALLTEVAAAVRQTHSLACVCDKISRDPGTGRVEHRQYLVSLLRPNLVRVDRYLIRAGGGRERLVSLLSDGKTRRTLLLDNRTEDEAAAANGGNVGLLLPDPLYDFYAPENSYKELVRQAHADGTFAGLTLDAPEEWEGTTYRVVTFTKAVQAGDKAHLYRNRMFVGADTLVHRLTVTDGAGVLLDDIGLRAVRVNAPLLPSDFTYTPLPVLPPARPAAPALLPVGAVAPDFTLTGSGGGPVSLAGLRGKTVILDFWATWCQPCLASLPDLNRVAARRGPGGVIALAVNVSDTQAAFDRWVPRHPQYGAVRFAIDPRTDGKDVATVLYHVSGLPTQYVIGPQGKVVAVFVGYNPSTKELGDALDRAAK